METELLKWIVLYVWKNKNQSKKDEKRQKQGKQRAERR